VGNSAISSSDYHDVAEDAMSFFENRPSHIVFQERLTSFIAKRVRSGAVGHRQSSA
jgi:hypothetical protein